ncbi:MAG: hypothetical protein APR54_04390 [Candidatus Cloacimonas sp. SDB]|nr:MAG: hypothetical protein APR54_04390 [Candidatus Cloacimonas sp. SDB]
MIREKAIIDIKKMNKYTSKFLLINDQINFIAENKIEFKEFDRIFDNVLKFLKIRLNDYKKIRVYINNGYSQFKKNKIYIGISKKLEEEYYLFMLFKHELIHLLIYKYFGVAPAIFWEGLPIYLSDYQYRMKYKNINYDEYCKVFLSLINLNKLSYILESEKYYARRYDYRIDIQCGSFIGFLVKKYNIDLLLDVFKKYEKPTTTNPVSNINNLLKSIYSKNLEELEAEWIEYLKKKIKLNKNLKNKLKNKIFYKRIPIKQYHCKFCYSPLRMKNQICDVCKSDNNIKILYK